MSGWVRHDVDAAIDFGIADPTPFSSCAATSLTFSVPTGAWTQISGMLTAAVGCAHPLAFIVSGDDTALLLDDVYIIPR